MKAAVRRILVVAVVCFGLPWSVDAQVKHLVYFTDKGITPGSLFEHQELIDEINVTLSKRCIDRRTAVLGTSAVSVKDLPVCRKYIEALQELGVHVCECLRWPNAISCYVPRDLLPSVRNLPFVKAVETIGPLLPFINDAPVATQKADMPFAKSVKGHRFDYGSSFAQAAFVDIPAVHDAGYTGEGVLIGMIDTGFKTSHPAFKACNLLSEYDFIFDDDETSNGDGEDPRQHLHGTMMFGSLAAFSEGTIVGYAPGATYVLAKTELVATDARAEEDRVAAAVEWLEAQGVDVISISVGWINFDDGSGYNRTNNDGEHSIASRALSEAYERGVTVITAAGNSPETGIAPPGDAKNALCVGGMKSDGEPSLFSASGPTADGRIKPDVMGFSEGYGVFVNAEGDSYSTGDAVLGTDFAATQATGVAALLLSAYPHLRNDQVRDILRKTAGNASSPDNSCGYGRLTATNALNFPNLSCDLSEYFIHKKFIGKDAMSGTVFIHMSINGSDFWNEQMAPSGEDGYVYGLPHCMTDDVLRFYITFTTHEGMTVREPADPTKIFIHEYRSWEISCEKSAVTGIDWLDAVPKTCALAQNYPNPFSSTTNVTFSLPRRTAVYLDVTDVTGRTVATLAEGVRDAGTYQLIYDISQLGRDLPNGVYLCRMRAMGEVHTMRMILSR